MSIDRPMWPSPLAASDAPFTAGLKKRLIYNHPAWRRVRKSLLETQVACQWCGAGERLEVHHKQKPRRDNAGTWFDPANLVVICRGCHFAHHHKERRAQMPEVWQQWNERVQQLLELED